MDQESDRTLPPSPHNSTEPATSAGFNTRNGTAGTQPGHAVVAWTEMTVRDAMNATRLTDQYRPPYLLQGKETIVIYWVRDPATNAWRRIREKLNHIKDPKQRKAYGAKRVSELGLQLSIGWNPIRDKDTGRGGVLLEKGMAQFLAAKARAKLSQHSLRSYQSYCNILELWLRANKRAGQAVGAFDRAAAQAFLQHSYLERKLSPISYNGYIRFGTLLWNWFKESGLANTNPFEKTKRMRTDPNQPTTRRPPTQEERRRIRPYLEKRPRFHAFAMLCFYCGIRPNEAFQLLPADFHLQSQSIIIPGPVAKNGRTQGIAIPDVLMPLLLALQLDKQRPEHFVFSTGFRPGRKQCDSRDSGKAWVRLQEATGLSRDVTFYQLKHAGARQLSSDGVEAVDLMNHLRHHDLHETTIYTRGTFDAGVRSVVSKASEF